MRYVRVIHFAPVGRVTAWPAGVILYLPFAVQFQARVVEMVYSLRDERKTPAVRGGTFSALLY